MRKQTSLSAREIFFFDCGRSYQTGLMCSVSKVREWSLQEFTCQCHLILIRYLDTKREDVILELYTAFKEGFEEGEAFKEEILKTIPFSMQVM